MSVWVESPSAVLCRLVQVLPVLLLIFTQVAQAAGFNSVNTGLRQGDLINSLIRTSIESVEQLKSAATRLKPGDAAVLRIERRVQFQYLAFRWNKSNL
jgi:hypothetical protein